MISLMRRLEQHFADSPGRSATMISWASQGIAIAGNLAIVPLVLHRVGAAAGIWFFLLTWIGLFTILDFGFSQCISRQITFSLGKTGFLPGRAKGGFIRVGGPRSIGSTVAASKTIFRIVSLVILLGGIAAERPFLFSGHMEAGIHARVCWYLIVFASIVLNETRVYSTALIGMLLVPWVRMIQLLQNLLQNFLILFFLFISPRLELLGIAILCSSLFGFWRLHSLWVHRKPPGVTMSPTKWTIVRRLWRLSWEQGVASASSYFIFAVNPIVIGYLAGAEAVSAYYLPLRIASILFSSFSEIVGPQVNFLIEFYRDHKIHAMLVRFFKIFLIVGLTSFPAYVAFSLAGPWAVDIWSGGKVNPAPAVFWIMGLYYFLALMQLVLACFITAHGVQPFARIAVVGAILNIGLLFLFVPRMGIVGATLATFTAQLLTSNWFMVWYAGQLLAQHAKKASLRAALQEAFISFRSDLLLR